MGALLGHYGLLLGGGGSGGGGYTAETNLWITRATALGATPAASTTDKLNALSVALAAASYSSKIVWLNPFFGSTIAEARVPLRDTKAVGAMANLGSSPFTNSDVGMAVGVQNPTEKNAYLDTLIKLDSIAAGGRAGLGFWERNWGAGTNVEPMGCHDATGSSRFVLDLRSSFQRFRYGDTTGTQAGPATTAGSKHYYGQRNGSDVTEIYADGASLGSNGASGDAGASENCYVMGCRYVDTASTPWKGRCAVAYITDGTMSSSDIAALHTLLNTYVITATGR